MRVIIFDVEHGFSAFVKSPTGCTLMIDCGKTEDFSPVEYIRQNELNGSQTYNGFHLTRLIVTHPHDDHIEDITSVTASLPPYELQRQVYRAAIKAPGAKQDEYENLDCYSTWQQTYNVPVPAQPNWGMQIDTFCLTPNEAYALDKNKYVNNSSIVTVVNFQGTEFTERFLFGADVEQAGWEALLKKEEFKKAVAGTGFYIAPHHGHSSGFSTELYKAIGRRPFVNLVSVHSRDENVDARYASDDFAVGTKVGGETRYMLSTRADGSIFVDVTPEGRYIIQTVKLPPNIANKALRW